MTALGAWRSALRVPGINDAHTPDRGTEDPLSCGQLVGAAVRSPPEPHHLGGYQVGLPVVGNEDHVCGSRFGGRHAAIFPVLGRSWPSPKLGLRSASPITATMP